jgi:Amt family ammonium transporter
VDDALDSFSIHAIGGLTGTILTSFFSTSKICLDHNIDGILYAHTNNDNSNNNSGILLGKQLLGIVIVALWSAIFTCIILKVINLFIDIRVSKEIEIEGLDIGLQGESVMSEKERDKKKMYQMMLSYQ